MTTSTIILAGLGNLGKRTLQALLKLESRSEIFAIDPSPDSIEAARTAADEIADSDCHSVTYCSTVAEIPRRADLAIVATSSRPRLAVLADILDTCEVRKVVLEKFLFPEVRSYELARELFARHAVDCWVSCPRPVWQGYQWLAGRVGGLRGNIMLVSGGRWNLASNAVHMLDCFCRVSGEKILAIDGTGLLPKIVENKRPGYLEVLGTMCARGVEGGQLILSCNEEPGLPFLVEWISPEGRYRIDEAAQRVQFEASDGFWGQQETSFPVLLASEMTEVYAQLLASGHCQLSTYEQIAPLHLQLIPVLNRIIHPAEPPDADCPVT